MGHIMGKIGVFRLISILAATKIINWSEFDILSLFGMLASVTENFKIFLKPDNDCHKYQFINSTKDGKVEILENYIHGKQVSSYCSWSLP